MPSPQLLIDKPPARAAWALAREVPVLADVASPRRVAAAADDPAHGPVLHVLPSDFDAIGGMEDFTRNLISQLAAHGVVSDVWHVPRSSLEGQRPAERAARSVSPVRQLHLARYRLPCFDPRRLRAYALIHVHGIGGLTDAVALSWRWHRRPVVVSTHGGIFHTQRALKLKQLYFHYVQPLIARSVSRYVACSVNDRELFAPLSPRTVLIENGVELFPPSAVRQSARCLWVGRWSANKELPDLIRAFAAARRLLPQLSLDVVGAPDSLTRSDLARLVGEAGLGDAVAIHESLPRPALAQLVAAAGLVLSASSHEGFGLAVIEAMSAGCVPVLNRIPVFVRFIGEACAGALTSFADPAGAGAEIAATARRLLSDGSGAEAARASAYAARFGWPAVAGHWLTLYQQVLAEASHV